jgi:3-oxoacyl-[acyl-carrier-protein] synthase-1
MEKVYITGIGMISAIGQNITQCLDSLLHGKHGIGPITHTETIHKEVFPVGEVKLTNTELRILAGVPENSTKRMTRTALLGIVAAKEALNNSGIQPETVRMGFVSATSVGGMDRSEDFIDAFFQDNTKGRLRDVAAHDCGDSTETIAEAIGATRLISTISTACSSSVNSLMYAAKLIKSGLLDCVVAGGTDAITRFTINGFNTLMILDKQHCRPFDDSRTGLNLGEGAGYVVLESERSVMARKAKALAILAGYANANDAFHQTASSPDGHGATLAMKNALAMSGLNAEDISYITVSYTHLTLPTN